VAGTVNLAIALAVGYRLSGVVTALIAGTVGFCGYGLSLVMFVVALWHLGTARTGAYFSAAPFVGALISLVAPLRASQGPEGKSNGYEAGSYACRAASCTRMGKQPAVQFSRLFHF
jgi:hypothetical protein